MTNSLMLNTDQTNCYNESGQNIPCSGSGQDGGTNRSHGVEETRFEVCGGIVTDHSNNLRWNHKASPTKYPLSWAEAFGYMAQLNRSKHHGIDNWRLPSRRELFSLVSHQHINPALPEGHPFTDVFPGYYWTASECRRLNDKAWYIHLGGGHSDWRLPNIRELESLVDLDRHSPALAATPLDTLPKAAGLQPPVFTKRVMHGYFIRTMGLSV